MIELFIHPRIIKCSETGYNGAKSYSEYNYAKPGVSSQIKRRHFEIALKLTRSYFHKVNVIDLGCADGPFLPSLSRYFNGVLGIEYNPKFAEQSRKAIYKQHLANVSIICNHDKQFSEIKKELGNTGFSIIFLMEVMEHVGNSWQTMYQDKLRFLNEASTLLSNDGIIVISVPKMTGFSFLFQVAGQFLFNLSNKKDISNLPLKSLLKCIFLNNTDDIEHLWRPYYTHIGFNHRKFEECININFNIIKSKSDWFQQIYVIRKEKK